MRISISANSLQIKVALRIVWITLSTCMFTVLLIAVFLPPETLLSISAYLSFPHETCIFCGMTRSFILIKQGALIQAYALNHLSIPLVLLLFINQALYWVFLFSRIKHVVIYPFRSLTQAIIRER